MARRIVHEPRGRPLRRGNGLTVFALCGTLILCTLIIVRARGQSTSRIEEPRASLRASEIIDIPVPIQTVKAGTKLRDVVFKSVAFYRDELAPGTLEDITSFEDSVAKVTLHANAPVVRERITDPSVSSTNTVIEKIPPGMRAMTIRVDETSAVEGWARSGSIVDVLLVERDKTTVIAERIKILSAERSTSPLQEDAEPVRAPSTVTILVTQEQCLAINTALPLGRIAFALRSQKDDDSWSDTTFTAERLKRRGGASSDKKSVVSGFISVREGPQREGGSYALADGKWVKADTVPEGFFAMQTRETPQSSATPSLSPSVEE